MKTKRKVPEKKTDFETANREYTWGENSEPSKRKSEIQKVLVTNRGKGPKGFERTDERLKEHVSGILTDDTELDASEIKVDVKKGDVILTGKVDTPQDKQRAKGILHSVSSISKIENKLVTGKKRKSNKNSTRGRRTIPK